ncbi:LytTR family transcriptional regulator DNA-binding domain-containing protein [Lysinibacillus sp. KU-BSD001]|uniref:LytTR family transcriptional regulator DNA-binding domain-containing protein n=1 Tax=Lysinibacillus sp. KU-BSD001 TaxID=3141328 RepID=UPI0036E72C62
MDIQLEAVFEDGKMILPACQIEGQVTGIYTDVQKMQLIMKQLQTKGYVHYATDGEYKRLRVEEAFRFYMGMAECKKPMDEMLALFGFTKQRKTKVKDLTLSEQKRLTFVRAYLYAENVLVIEEPFYRMDEHSREMIAQLIQQLVEQGKQIILLANNIEELLIATSNIIRMDQSGCHKMDFTEEPHTPSTEEPIIKIEKIQTKKNDKTILFNPPEIDYIESVDGEILVNVAGTSYSCSLTLQELEKRLKAYGFYRCHRSYIVNLQKVREIITWTKNSYSLKLHVGEGIVVPLSRSKLSELKELIGIA